MPLGDGKLAGNERGSESVPVLHDLQQIIAFWLGCFLKAPVVQDQQVGTGQAA